MAVAGHLAKGSASAPDYAFTSAITAVGSLSTWMFFLFAAASLAPTCFCCFVISTCFGTMLPKVPRTLSTYRRALTAAQEAARLRRQQRETRPR